MAPTVSFDVFDTAITRCYARPTDLFVELGDLLAARGLIAESSENWAKSRADCEVIARSLRPAGEVTLSDIYSELSKKYDWSTPTRDAAMALEVRLEMQSVRAVPEMSKRILEAVANGSRIVFTSDMYLSRDVIQEMLQKAGLWLANPGLYVSSEKGVSKATGELFNRVTQAEQIRCGDVWHIGDNVHSDYVVPRSLGIKAERFERTRLTRFEEAMLQEADLSKAALSKLVAAGRLARLAWAGGSRSEETIWNTSCNVSGPLIFSFVFWCLVTALEEGIDRLYFVARDGQIMCRVAQLICDAWQFDIECRYLYGSRHAWNLPSVTGLEPEDLEWIFSPTNYLSLRSLFERVDLTPEQFVDVLEMAGFDKSRWNNHLSIQDRDNLRKLMLESRIYKAIADGAAKARVGMLGYLCQEGVGDGVPFGVVDVGWSGRTLKSLSKVLMEAGLHPSAGMRGYYMALDSKTTADPTDVLRSFFYGPDDTHPRRGCLGNRAIIELFLAADHGGVVGYEHIDGRWRAILRESKNTNAMQWGLEAQQEAICEYCRRVLTELKPSDLTPDEMRRAAIVATQAFIEQPSSEEAAVFGAYRLAEDQTENRHYELAPVYGLRELYELGRFGRHVHHNVWIPGVFARFSRVSWRFLNTLRLVRRIRQRVGAW